MENGKMGRILVSILLGVCCLSGMGCGQEKQAEAPETPAVEITDEMVAQNLLEFNRGNYRQGECAAEGHEILGQEQVEEGTKIYLLAMYGEYGFQDGHFVKISGSGVIPTVMVLDETGKCLRLEVPADGSDYEESLKMLFPEEYLKDVSSFDEEKQKQISEKEREYARNYLQQIGREAEIGDYSDFDWLYFWDVNIPQEAYEKVNEFAKTEEGFQNYPDWIGSSETLEGDAGRMVYEMNFDAEKNEMVYTKYSYDSGEIQEQWKFDGTTGELISHEA